MNTSKLKWSIVLPSYNNYTEVYFTVQSLRLYHNLRNCEIVVVDNFGDIELEKFIKEKGCGVVRYEKYTEITGVSAAKNHGIAVSRGEFILCMDSHCLIRPGTLDGSPWSDDLVQGPNLFNNMIDHRFEWLPQWRSGMWGIWAPGIVRPEDFEALEEHCKKEIAVKMFKEEIKICALPTDPFEIWAMGAGFFACRRESWLGFNPNFRGFGGETGYLQEKYRKAGRKVWCDPRMEWVHYFCNIGRTIPFPCPMIDRVRNYLIGFAELGIDTKEMESHFASPMMKMQHGNIIEKAKAAI